MAPKPLRRRRALAEVKYNFPSSMLSSEPEPQVQEITELESLILTCINQGRHKISKSLKIRLTEKVILGGSTFESPDFLYGNDPKFKAKLESRVAFLKTLPGMNIHWAVACVRQYNKWWVELDQTDLYILEMP